VHTPTATTPATQELVDALDTAHINPHQHTWLRQHTATITDIHTAIGATRHNRHRRWATAVHTGLLAPTGHHIRSLYRDGHTAGDIINILRRPGAARTRYNANSGGDAIAELITGGATINDAVISITAHAPATPGATTVTDPHISRTLHTHLRNSSDTHNVAHVALLNDTALWDALHTTRTSSRDVQILVTWSEHTDRVIEHGARHPHYLAAIAGGGHGALTHITRRLDERADNGDNITALAGQLADALVTASQQRGHTLTSAQQLVTGLARHHLPTMENQPAHIRANWIRHGTGTLPTPTAHHVLDIVGWVLAHGTTRQLDQLTHNHPELVANINLIIDAIHQPIRRRHHTTPAPMLRHLAAHATYALTGNGRTWNSALPAQPKTS
jgi:hypothetical protein